MSEYEALKDLDEKQKSSLERFLHQQSTKPTSYGFKLKKKGIPGYLRQLLKDADMGKDLKGLRIQKIKENE